MILSCTGIGTVIDAAKSQDSVRGRGYIFSGIGTLLKAMVCLNRAHIYTAAGLENFIKR